MTKEKTPVLLVNTRKTNSHIAAEMANKIKDVIHEYDDQITLALALGVLRIVEIELIDDAKS